MSDSYANPLPPPPRKGLGAEAQKTFGDKQLSNKDFKLLLSTPRPGGKPNMTRSKPPPSAGEVNGGEGGFAAPKPKAKKSAWRAKMEAAEEEKSEEPQYRDRAKERREGRLIDYEVANADLAALVQGQEMDVSSISVEDSKFLGGDVEHTHLVKGLDYALLNKMRGDQEKEKKKVVEETEKKTQKPETRFMTAMGRAVYRTLCESRKAVPTDSFLPGRTAFVYRLEEDELGNEPPDMPTTLRRSKADCPKLTPTTLGGVDKQLMERVASIMSYVQLAPGGKKNKIKKKDRARILGEYADQPAKLAEKPTTFGSLAKVAPPKPTAAAADDSDDDIFGDAGKDYVCDLVEKHNDGDTKKGGYFDAADDEDDLPLLQGPARPPPGGAAAYYNSDDVDMEVEGEEQGAALPPEWRQGEGEGGEGEEEGEEQKEDQKPAKRKSEQSAALKGFAEEAYAECFPEYYDMAHEIVDSDDEGGAGKAGKAEAEPQADPKLGVKRSERRKNAAAGKKNPDSQIKSQLGQIKSLLQEKGHTKDMVAFQEAADEPNTGGGGGGGGAKRRKRL